MAEENNDIRADKSFGTKDRIDFLFKIINRFDFYINSTNTKASLIIAWNGVLIGTVLLKYGEILQAFGAGTNARALSVWLLFLIGGSAVLSNFIVFSVIFPFLKFNSKRAAVGKMFQDESLLFFSAVAKLDSEDYLKKLVENTEDDILMDLADQTTTVAQGLNRKMYLLRISLWFIAVQLFLIILLLLLNATL